MKSSEQTSQSSYQVKIGRDCIRVVCVFTGTETASQRIHEAAVKKILYDASEDRQQGCTA